MGLETGLKLGQKVITAWTKTGASNSMLAMRPVKVNIEGLKLAPQIKNDIVQLSKKAETYTQEEVSNMIRNFYDTEIKDTMRMFANGNGSFDKEVIDTLMELKSLGKCVDHRVENSPQLVKFMMDNGKISPEIKQKFIEILKNTDEDSFADIDSFFNYMPGHRETIPVKKELLSLIDNIKQILESEDTQSVITKCLKEGVDEAKIMRLQKLKDFSIQEIANGENGCYYLNYLSGIQCRKFLDSPLLPSKGLIKIYAEDTSKVENALKALDKYHFSEIGLEDTFVLDRVIFNKNSRIKQLLDKKALNAKGVVLKPDSSNPKNYVMCLYNGDVDGVRYVFDKKTQKLIYTQKITPNTNGITRNTFIEKSGQEINQIYRCSDNGFPELVTESRTSKNGQIFFVESPVSGQADIYRIGKNGKIRPISKAFRDPITGEEIVKRNFKSFSGTKTNYNYSAEPNGNSALSYVIKDKSGQELMNINRTVRILDKNHTIHNVNGKIYEVFIGKSFIRIIDETGKRTTINLKKLVPDGNPEIIATLKQLPPEELIAIKKLRVPSFTTMEENGAQVVYNDMFDRMFNKNLGPVKTIELGPDSIKSLSSYLHELGHIKQKSFDKQTYQKILDVYKKEVSVYRNKTHCTDNVTMDYIIESSNHYLKDRGYGALEEAISDINALLRYPNDDRALTERTIKFMEQFPETIAEVVKYL